MPEIKDILETVQKDIQASKEKLAELATVEKYLLDKIGIQSPSAEKSANGLSLKTSDVPGNLSKMTQIKAALKVLQESGKTMSTQDIVADMIGKGYYPEPANIGDLKNSIFSIMLKRAKNGKLFRKEGRGLWSLIQPNSPESHQETIAPQRTKPSHKNKTSAIDGIRELVNESPSQEFTTAVFFEKLKQKGIIVKRGTVKNATAQLVADGFLQMIFAGSGRRLSIFKKKH
jgi:hypothetical protein